jgi:hypothetical protein
LVSITPPSIRPKQNKQELTAVKIVTARRSVLRTFAFTMATSVIGSTATPWVAAIGATLMPAGARHLDGNHHAARE